jgi:hypothetical protein
VCRRKLGTKGEQAAYLTPIPAGAVVYGTGDTALVRRLPTCWLLRLRLLLVLAAAAAAAAACCAGGRAGACWR